MRKKIIFDVDLSDISNINENLVIDMMETVLDQDKNLCRCQSCLEDIYSLSLKLIEPRYHPNSLVEKFSTPYISAQREFNEKAEDEVRKAVKIVINNPHH